MITKKEIVKAAEEGHLYDLIANRGYEMSKDDLITVAKECYYAGTCSSTSLTHEEYKEELVSNLQEYISE